MNALTPEMRTEHQASLLDQLAKKATEKKPLPVEAFGAWQGIRKDLIPKRIEVASGSFRKYVLCALQLLHLNGQDFPEMLAEYQNQINPLAFLEYLKTVFDNKNGELQTPLFAGYLYGSEVWFVPTKGEKHGEEFSQFQEADHKARWAYEDRIHTMTERWQAIDGNLLPRAQQMGIPTIEEDQQEQVVTVAFDTLDEIIQYFDFSGHFENIRMPKPLSRPGFPQDYKTNPDALQAFNNEYAQIFYQEGVELTGRTAVVALDKTGRQISNGETAVTTTVREGRVQEILQKLDPGAAGGGLLQLLLGFEYMQDFAMAIAEMREVDVVLNSTDQEALYYLMNCHLNGNKEATEFDFQAYLRSFPQEKRAMASFHLLAQIMGTPVWMMVKVIQDGLRQETQRHWVASPVRAVDRVDEI